jgi:hypothetical protein
MPATAYLAQVGALVLLGQRRRARGTVQRSIRYEASNSAPEGVRARHALARLAR